MFVAAVLLCFESIWHASSSVVGMINGLIFFLADSSRLILRILMEPFFSIPASNGTWKPCDNLMSSYISDIEYCCHTSTHNDPCQEKMP